MCFYAKWAGAPRANAGCLLRSGQALEKAQYGNGQLLEKVGMDLGLAPLPLGFGATPAWGWRRAGLGSTNHANYQRDKAVLDLPIPPTLFAILRPLTAARSAPI